MPTAGQPADQPDFASVYGETLAPRFAAPSELAEQYRFANLHQRHWHALLADVTDL